MMAGVAVLPPPTIDMAGDGFGKGRTCDRQLFEQTLVDDPALRALGENLRQRLSRCIHRVAGN